MQANTKTYIKSKRKCWKPSNIPYWSSIYKMNWEQSLEIHHIFYKLAWLQSKSSQHRLENYISEVIQDRPHFIYNEYGKKGDLDQVFLHLLVHDKESAKHKSETQRSQSIEANLMETRSSSENFTCDSASISEISSILLSFAPRGRERETMSEGAGRRGRLYGGEGVEMKPRWINSGRSSCWGWIMDGWDIIWQLSFHLEFEPLIVNFLEKEAIQTKGESGKREGVWIASHACMWSHGESIWTVHWVKYE